MKLTGMKMSKKKKAEMQNAPVSGNGPDYPYGLALNLDKDSLKKLGMDEMPEVGDTCMIHAVGEITRVSQSASDGRDDKSVEIQITKLSVMPGMDDEGEYREATKAGFAEVDGE